jgi:hypothetical protein
VDVSDDENAVIPMTVLMVGIAVATVPILLSMAMQATDALLPGGRLPFRATDALLPGGRPPFRATDALLPGGQLPFRATDALLPGYPDASLPCNTADDRAAYAWSGSVALWKTTRLNVSDPEGITLGAPIPKWWQDDPPWQAAGAVG